jgi:hypothetical protein
MTKKVSNFCCERFGECYASGEIRYAYERHSNIDETEWIIGSFGHLYYCPFCGAFIKGHGFGNYDQKYPPAKETRVLRQRAE